MIDLTDRLAHLRPDTPPAVDDATVRADLDRGHAALTRRRTRRGLSAGGAVLALAAICTAAYLGTASSPARHDDRQRAIGPAHPTSTHQTGTHQTGTQRPATQPAGTQHIRLVDYTGKQQPPFSVTRVPEGYVLQGTTDTSLDVARAGDHSSLDSYVDKLVVMLLSTDATPSHSGTPVSVNGHRGYLADGDGALVLQYNDGTHDIVVQSWDTIKITPAQLVQFAEGITVSSSAVAGHG